MSEQLDQARWVLPGAEEAEEMRSAMVEERARLRRRELERRAKRRVELHARVSGCSETNFFTGFSQDISEGGIFVSTLAPPAVGERVEVAIQVEGEEPESVSGEVRWIRYQDDLPTGCGIQFVDLTGRQLEHVRRMMGQAQQEPLFYEV